jgi:hypothetical protein
MVGGGMHGRLAIALLALTLLVPASASATTGHDGTGGGARRAGVDISRIEAHTASAGAIVQVTLRARLSGRIAVDFTTRGGSGNARPAGMIRRGRRVAWLFSGDARNLARVIVRTRGPNGRDRATLRLPRVERGCDALTRLARNVRELGRRRGAVKQRLRAIARRRRGSECATQMVPIDRAAPPAPLPSPGFTPPAARFPLAHGLTPGDPVTAGDALTFTDASVGTGLVEWRWDFGDGVTAQGRTVKHAYAEPGRYTALLTVRNALGQTSAFGQELFVRGPGTATFDAPAVACPDPGETVTVTVTRRVPSWAQIPAQVSFAIGSSACMADASDARDLEITPGNAGNSLDAWGREESTLRFRFDLSDGTGNGTVTPEVTASWS